MWHNNVKIQSTFVHHATQWAWALVEGLGWRRIKDGAADGVSNLLILLSTAQASGRTVHVLVDSSDNTIRTAYMI